MTGGDFAQMKRSHDDDESISRLEDGVAQAKARSSGTETVRQEFMEWEESFVRHGNSMPEQETQVHRKEAATTTGISRRIGCMTSEGKSLSRIHFPSLCQCVVCSDLFPDVDSRPPHHPLHSSSSTAPAVVSCKSLFSEKNGRTSATVLLFASPFFDGFGRKSVQSLGKRDERYSCLFVDKMLHQENMTEKFIPFPQTHVLPVPRVTSSISD